MRPGLWDEADRTLNYCATKADVANLKTGMVGPLLVVGLHVVGTVEAIVAAVSCWVGREAELYKQRERDFEILERFGRAFRDQTAEEIEEAVTQAVAEVRGEERRGVERRTAVERFGSSRTRTSWCRVWRGTNT